MIDTKQIVDTYKRLPEGELTELAANPVHLRKEIIPLLIDELKRRKLNEAAEELTAYYNKPDKQAIEDTHLVNINDEVKERMEHGESIDSIKADLQERGINILGLVHTEQQHADEFYEKLTDLKRKKNISELQQHLVQEENLTEDESLQVLAQLKKRARSNKIYGTLILVLGLASFVLAFFTRENPVLSIGPYAIIILGVIKIMKGYIQGRK